MASELQGREEIQLDCQSLRVNAVFEEPSVLWIKGLKPKTFNL